MAEIFLIMFMLVSLRFGKRFAVIGTIEAKKAHLKRSSHIRPLVMVYFFTSAIIFFCAHAVAFILLTKLFIATQDTGVINVFGKYWNPIVVVSVITASTHARIVMIRESGR